MKGLGRGFESLIPTELIDDEFDPTLVEDKKESELKELKIEDVIRDEDQPRREFNKEAIEAIADEAIRQKTGARGLRAIVEKFLTDIMFEIPSIEGKKQLEITKDIVDSKNCKDVTSLLKIEENIA